MGTLCTRRHHYAALNSSRVAAASRAKSPQLCKYQIQTDSVRVIEGPKQACRAQNNFWKARHASIIGDHDAMIFPFHPGEKIRCTVCNPADQRISAQPKDPEPSVTQGHTPRRVCYSAGFEKQGRLPVSSALGGGKRIRAPQTDRAERIVIAV